MTSMIYSSGFIAARKRKMCHMTTCILRGFMDSLLTLHIMLSIILFSIISIYSISKPFGTASTGYLPWSPLIGSQKHSILVSLNSMKLSHHDPSLCYCTLHQRFSLLNQLAAKRKTCKHVVTTKTFGYVYCTR